jgi:hypothetical protein
MHRRVIDCIGRLFAGRGHFLESLNTAKVTVEPFCGWKMGERLFLQAKLIAEKPI